MSKKKLIISGLCMALLSVMPVQAAVNDCNHPQTVPASGYCSWYETTSDKHQEWGWMVTEVCTVCGEELGYIKHGDWEDHDWDLWNPEHGNTGQTVWEGRCTICNYEGTVCTYP